MLLSMLVPYSAKVVPQGKRSPINTDFIEYLPIEFPSPTSEEAPVAVKWEDRHPDFDAGMQPNVVSAYNEGGIVTVDGKMHTRFFEGAHYWPVVFKVNRDENVGLGRALSAEQFEKRVREESSVHPLSSFEFPNHRVVSEYPAGFPLVETAYRKVAESSREQAISHIKSQIDDRMIVVDGMLYQKGPEPVYIFYAVVHRDDDIQYLLKIVPNDPQWVKNDNVFAIDQFDEARHQALIPELGNMGRASINDFKRATLMLDHALTGDLDTQVISTLAREAVDLLNTQPMKSFSMAEGKAYLEFRHAVWNFDKTNDIDAIVDAAIAYKDCMGTRNFNKAEKNIMQLIERHLMRPMDMTV